MGFPGERIAREAVVVLVGKVEHTLPPSRADPGAGVVEREPDRVAVVVVVAPCNGAGRHPGGPALREQLRPHGQMLVDRRAQRHEAAHPIGPPDVRLSEPLQQPQQRHDGAFAMRHHIDVRRGIGGVDVGHSLGEGLEDLASLLLELGDDLHVAEVVLQQPLQVEREQAGLLGQEGDPGQDRDRLDHLGEHLLELAKVLLPAAALPTFGAPAHAQPLDDGPGPFLGVLERVLLVHQRARNLGPVHLGEREASERLRRIRRRDRERRAAGVKVSQRDRGRLLIEAAELPDDRLNGRIAVLVAHAVHRDDNLG